MPALLSLRDAHKALTRTRIQDAARELFFSQGYVATTIDQITIEAGTRRSTLYTHFRDKEDILDAITQDYVIALVGIMGRLPGPTPVRAEIDLWIQEVAAFVARERTPTILFAGLGDLDRVPVPVAKLGDRMFNVLATNVLAFRQAATPGPEQGRARFWATMTLRELMRACLKNSRQEGTWYDPTDMFSVVGEILEIFVQRYSSQR